MAPERDSRTKLHKLGTVLSARRPVKMEIDIEDGIVATAVSAATTNPDCSVPTHIFHEAVRGENIDVPNLGEIMGVALGRREGRERLMKALLYSARYSSGSTVVAVNDVNKYYSRNRGLVEQAICDTMYTHLLSPPMKLLRPPLVVDWLLCEGPDRVACWGFGLAMFVRVKGKALPTIG